MHPAPLLRLPEVELQAMVRDGHIVRFGHPGAVGYISVAERITAADRARTLQPLLSGRFAVGGASAVWVHAGGPAPSHVTLATPRGFRPPKDATTWVRYRSTAPSDDAVVVLGGVRVVRPWRALLDLLHDPAATQNSIDRAVHLLGLDPEALLARQASGRRPFATQARQRAALAKLLRLDSVHVVDPVDAPDGVEHAVEVRGVPHLEGELADGQACL